MSGGLTTGGVDSSIPLQAGRGVGQQPDALTQIGKFASIQNALNQAKLFPGQLQLQGQAIAGNTADLGRVAQVRWAQMMAPILADPNVPDEDLPKHGTQAAAVLETMGLPGHMITRSLAATGGPGIRNQYAALARSSMAPVGQEAAEAAPAQGTISTGDATYPTQTGRPLSTDAAQIRIPGSGVSQGLTPDFLAQQVGRPATAADVAKLRAQGVNIDVGTKLDEAMVTRLYQQGQGDLTQGGRRVAPPGSAPASRGMGTGAYPTSPTAGPIASPTTGAPAPGSPVVVGNPPGFEQGNTADVSRFKQEQAGLSDRQTAVQSLIKAKDALQLVTTGRGSGNLNAMRGFLTTLDDATAGAIGLDKAKISTMNYDLAHKYTVDYAKRAADAATGKTDLSRTMSSESNASTDPISNLAALEVVKTNIGRERQMIAQNMTAPDQTGIGYGSHAGKFSNDTDPMAFGWDHRTADERAAYLKKLRDGKHDAEYKKFLNSLAIAAQNKLINVPGASQ